jgi:hypothetical protein
MLWGIRIMGRDGRARVCAVSWAILACALSAPAMAQEQETGAGPQVFAADYFETYNPVTAADMVAQVPGFVLEDGEDRRGFGGTAGNLLINGERPSSKTAPRELLQRIPAGNVIRIELLSGTDAPSDVRGQSRLVNVVVRRVPGQDAATTYTIGARYLQYSNRIAPTLQASRSIALAPQADLSLNFTMPNTFGRGVEAVSTRDGNGVLLSRRYQEGEIERIAPQVSAALNWRAGQNDTVNFNLQASPAWVKNDNSYSDFNPDGDLTGTLTGFSRASDVYTAEFGADWEHRFSPGFSVKTIGLVSLSNQDTHAVFNVVTLPATMSTRIQDTATEGGERVGRVQFTWNASNTHTLEFGGEGAFNYRDTSLDIASGPTGGTLTPVPLAVANARVEELRGEAFITDVWTLGTGLTLESGFNFEVSTITQTGDQMQERSFSYAKPHVSAAWEMARDRTLRFSLSRDVAQLDFSEFSSAVDFVNTSTIRGNPNLVPEQTWKSRLELDTRFGPRSAANFAVFYDRVEDVHDLIDIGGFDAYGNIGDGTRKGVEIRAAAPLTALGMPNIELRFSGIYQSTEVTDPITGETRSFSISQERTGSPPSSATLNGGSKDWAYAFNFRQVLPEIRSSWGIDMAQWAGRREYRRAEILTYDRPEPKVDIYFETSRFAGVTLRVFANNILSPADNRDRIFYQGDRSSGVIERIEHRWSEGGQEGTRSFGFQASGRF